MKKTLLALCLMALAWTASGQILVHYWNFNNSGSEPELLAPTISLVSGSAFEHIAGGASAIQITSNTGQGFDIINPNARNGDPAGTHLRFNDPIGGALVVSLPTTGYEQIVVKYATRRSGSGAGTQIVEYSTDGSNFLPFTTINPVDGDPTLQTLDFSGIPTVQDNANFKIRITFEQGPGGDGGNNRFDNFTLDAIQLGSDTFAPVVTIAPANGAIDQDPGVQPTIQFNEAARLVNDSPILDTDIASIVELRLNDSAGAPVAFTGTIAGNTITIVPDAALANSQTYYLALKANTVEDLSDNAVVDDQISVFTVISEQTQFQPGDILPIAYRMNATGAEDEVAFVTFVNILPGTQIRMTDAKYTDNTPAQCAGGIIWTSPNFTMPSGSVFVVQNDAGTASVGTVSGNTFGLSSSGDQMIVYTGVNTAPSHITALSSNAWVTGPLTSCSGNFSKLPATLADGVSSINLSTAPGNVSGNTVNAYYNGPLTGAVNDLKTAILDPANWIGEDEGTPPQVWPNYVFPGPPNVTLAEVASSNSIRLGFNNDLDPVSAEDPNNYIGIAGLQSVEMTDNGTLADTVLLTYAADFVNGVSYALDIFGVIDSEARPMVDTFTYAFDYVTTLSFENRYLSVDEGAGTISFNLLVENPSTADIQLVYKGAPFSTADDTDFSFSTTTISLTGTSDLVFQVDIPVEDDYDEEQDEYFVLALENSNGVSVSGENYITLYIRDNDRLAPAASLELELEFRGRYTVNNPDEEAGLAEIVAFDPESERLFTISTELGQFDIVDFSDPANPTEISVVDMTSYGSGVTSIASKDGVVVVSVPGINNEQENGSVVFFDTDGNFISQVTVGALPDMVVFTPDGKYVLTADEGQPNDSYSIDPEGSVSLIDISGGVAGLTQANVTTLGFTAFNAQTADLVAAGVRLTQVNSTLSQDLEPEYITIAPNSETAWVTLQENNAIAEIDLTIPEVVAIWPLGTKDYSAFGNGLDLSDRNDFIHIANWPVQGFFIPDGVANFEVGGATYLITANEGDEKEYDNLDERITVASASLDSAAFPHAEMLKENHNMGRFRMSNLQGDTDDDGDFDEIYSVGARSFSIWNTETGELVFDSGDDFEKITAADPLTAPIFNADNEDNEFKGRSRAKGPEPEGVVISSINDRLYAFISLERIGGVMVYDITDPENPTFTDYVNSRDNEEFAGDNGAEGILFIGGQDSPDGKTYVLTANEISGTVAVFEVLGVIIDAKETLAKGQLEIYPNPVGAGKVFFSRPASYQLFDMSGRLLAQGENTNNADASHLLPGMYLIRFDDGSVQKLVRE